MANLMMKIELYRRTLAAGGLTQKAREAILFRLHEALHAIHARSGAEKTRASLVTETKRRGHVTTDTCRSFGCKECRSTN